MSEGGRPRDPDVDARIVVAARRILDAEGADAVSVARVAREADVGRPTVYRRYRDAGDLLRGVLFAELDAILAANQQVEIPDQPFIDSLVTMAEASMQFYAAHPERSRALLTAAVFAEPRWQVRWDALNAEVAALAIQAMQIGQRRGELPADADLELCVTAYFSLFLAVLIGGLVGAYGDVDGWSATLRRLLEQHFEGLRQRARDGL